MNIVFVVMSGSSSRGGKPVFVHTEENEATSWLAKHYELFSEGRVLAWGIGETEPVRMYQWADRETTCWYPR